MTPPVCIDVTGDGVGDLLMSAYEGLITLYDGETLDQIWSTPFPNMESYRYVTYVSIHVFQLLRKVRNIY